AGCRGVPKQEESMSRWMHAVGQTLALVLAACTVGGPAGAVGLSAVWANDGGDKVAQEELRAARGSPSVRNKVWNGERIRLFGARNEVLGFNVVLEAAE